MLSEARKFFPSRLPESEKNPVGTVNVLQRLVFGIVSAEDHPLPPSKKITAARERGRKKNWRVVCLPSSEIVRSIGASIARFVRRAIKISLINLGEGRAGVESAGKRACSTRPALINPDSARLLAPFRAASS